MEGSVLERNDLEEFMKLAEESHREFETQRYAQLVDVDSHVLVRGGAVEHEKPQIDIGVRIPRRPHWTPGMSAEKLADLEMDNFLSWRKVLADYEENKGYILTPFEKNLDFWRQLWRTVERSDVIFQIIDARDPLFYYCEDLTRYVEEVAEFQGRKKYSVVLMNKSDFVPKEMREKWRRYFQENHSNTHLEFFSALHELSKAVKVEEDQKKGEEEEEASDAEEQELTSADSKAVLGKGIAEDDSDVLTVEGLMDLLKDYAARYGDKVTIGMVGFPNVGKSTVINALWGAKKVSMSRQPGKTKHLQTLELVTEQGEGSNPIQLCDCPGLVFPTAVRSKADLVISGTVPIDYLRDYRPSIDLIVEKIGLEKLLEHYKCGDYCSLNFRRLGETRALLSAYAVSHKKFLKLGVPDEYAAARVVLRDYCIGPWRCQDHPGSGDENHYHRVEGSIVAENLSGSSSLSLFWAESDLWELKLLGISHYEYPPGMEESELSSEMQSIPTNEATEGNDTLESPEVAEEEGMAEDEMALELKELHEFLQSRGGNEQMEEEEEDEATSKESLKKPTKRAMRMAMKKAGKNKNSQGTLYDEAGRVSASLASKINPTSAVLNPGSRGRTSRKLQDPYGCHTDTRH
ncbi:large subunit GTPase 1 [Perkinsus chesapeaki]|uniref:Large subunit GTPase 1 n=1 Tax=Perkinsus chesapeaki TaxID=330153 RepID=A0A7J6LJM1_PERCH|nr:large subunit GTPase 1 [Perkinsus chesapeaki]